MGMNDIFFLRKLIHRMITLARDKHGCDGKEVIGKLAGPLKVFVRTVNHVALAATPL